MLVTEFLNLKLKFSEKLVQFSEELAAHERESLRKIARNLNIELRVFEVKSEGPQAELEAEFSSLDFFSPQKIIYLHIRGSQKKWTAESKRIWEKILSQSDPAANCLFVSSEQDLQVSGRPLRVINGSRCANPGDWLRYFNSQLAPAAQLDLQKLKFLSAQDFGEILELAQWIQLWSLGGDPWAEHMFGWGGEGKTESRTPDQRNLSYEWVDAALAGNKSKYFQLCKRLVEQEGEDPIRLLALLGKSVKIMAQLYLGEEIVGEAPFLINKLRHTKFRPEILDWWCRCDLALKSTRADALGLLVTLP